MNSLLAQLVARLLNETKGPLLFLQRKDGRFVLGWGAREESFSAPGDLEKVWLGGKSFLAGFKQEKKTPKSDTWQEWPEAYFFVPRFFVEGNAKEGNLKYHNEKTTEGEDEAWENFWTETHSRAMDLGTAPLRLEALVSPHARREWDELCAKIEAAFERGELEKVVPARKQTFVADHEISPAAVFLRFFEKGVDHGHVFAFRHGKDAFLGASPELLFKAEREGESFRVEVPAIAGTRPRGKDASSDESLATELKNSAKERKEHELVVDFIKKKLESAGTIRECPAAPILLKLPRLQHLFTPVVGELRNLSRVESFLHSLHPTPAMCGQPQAGAAEFLARHELWNRGYYASPLGYMAGPLGEACFVVGIRGCLISEEKVHVFAGAGYVKGSVAEQEWQETQQKIDSILAVFGNTSRDG